MLNCVWCGDEIKAGLWEIHKCIEEKDCFREGKSDVPN
jgi:hypothetical protein